MKPFSKKLLLLSYTNKLTSTHSSIYYQHQRTFRFFTIIIYETHHVIYIIVNLLWMRLIYIQQWHLPVSCFVNWQPA
jgi:hypothetical protein